MWRNHPGSKKIEDYEKYKSERKKAKKLVRNRKGDLWKKMEQDNKSHQKPVYKVRKSWRTKKTQI